jgi:hypothetical protein
LDLQVKKEVASSLEGEREKQERIRLAAAKRELEKKEAVAETEGHTATMVAGEDINGSSEEQEKRSKSLRRKLFRVLKKSVAPWRSGRISSNPLKGVNPFHFLLRALCGRSVSS